MKYFFLMLLLITNSYCSSSVDFRQMTSGEIAEYKNTRIYKKENKTEIIEEVSRSRPFHFSGKIFNITKYSSHTRIVIENGSDRIKLVVNERIKKKENDFLTGYCTKFSYGEYSNCSVY